MDKEKTYSCAVALKSESGDCYLFHNIVQADTEEQAEEIFTELCKEEMDEEWAYCYPTSPPSILEINCATG